MRKLCRQEGQRGPGCAHPVTRGAAAWPQTSRPWRAQPLAPTTRSCGTKPISPNTVVVFFFPRNWPIWNKINKSQVFCEGTEKKKFLLYITRGSRCFSISSLLAATLALFTFLVHGMFFRIFFFLASTSMLLRQQVAHSSPTVTTRNSYSSSFSLNAPSLRSTW